MLLYPQIDWKGQGLWTTSWLWPTSRWWRRDC